MNKLIAQLKDQITLWFILFHIFKVLLVTITNLYIPNRYNLSCFSFLGVMCLMKVMRLEKCICVCLISHKNSWGS